MKTSLSSLFIFLFVTFTVSAAWGQRTVGNGGGLGEMKMFYLFETLERYAVPCLERLALCRLGQREQQALAEIISNLKLQRGGAGISFDQNLGRPFISVGGWGQNLVFDSISLATPQGITFSFGELGALLIDGLAAKATKPTTGLGQKVFKDVQERSSSVQVRDLILHDLRIQHTHTQTQLLVLEEPQQSLDLTQKVEALIPCPSIKSWSVDRMNSGENVFVVDLSWTCHSSQARENGILLIQNAERLRLVN